MVDLDEWCIEAREKQEGEGYEEEKKSICKEKKVEEDEDREEEKVVIVRINKEMDRGGD